MNALFTFTESQSRRKGRRTRQADTNVLAVKFTKLTDPSNIHTGDAVTCSNVHCTAILSHLSKLSDSEDPDKDEKVIINEHNPNTAGLYIPVHVLSLAYQWPCINSYMNMYYLINSVIDM